MAQQQNKQNRPKQPQDPYAQTGKRLASAVQRLRGWVGSDPTRTPELADALVAVTEHRLLGHAYTVAPPEAQEAVKLAAQQLTANGPIGPYTSVADAARYVTAVVHLGVIQGAAGLPEAAAETVRSLSELREQLESLPLTEALAPTTVVWALACTARGALVADDVPAANAYVDAMLQRVAEAGLRTDAEAAYVVVDADRLVSDARWSAGLADDALTHLHVARETYDSVVDGRLAQPGRLSPALLQRLAEPLYGIYRDLADRLLAVGEVDLGLVTRRQLIDLLAGVAGKDEVARVQLAGSLGDLVRDLRALDRTDEADLVAEELAARPAADRAAAGELSAGIPRGTGAVRWEPLDAFAAYAGASVDTSAGVAAAEAELQRDTAARLVAEREEAHRLEEQRLEVVRREAERRQAERAEESRRAAERAEVERADAARREFERIEAERAETERQAAGAEAERRERQRRREERIEAHRLEEERRAAERAEAERAALEQREAERRAADPAELERLELERLQAELAALEAAAAETARAETEAAQAEIERVAEEERARARAEAEAEWLEAEWLEAERRAREEAERQEAEEASRVQAERDRVDRERAARDRKAAHTSAAETIHQPAESQIVESVPGENQPVEVAAQEPQQVEPAPPEPEPVQAVHLEAEPVQPPPSEPEPELDRGPETQREADREPETQREPDREPEPQPETEPEPEPVEDELAAAHRAWQEARGRGDRKEARALNERVVDLLRPRAEQDLAEYGPRLLYALEELSGARLRGGDLWGSRAPAKEAKALAKSLGRRRV